MKIIHAFQFKKKNVISEFWLLPKVIMCEQSSIRNITWSKVCANINIHCLCRIADPDQPVLWLDQMPARSLSRGFNNHINLIRYESFTEQPSPMH